MKSSQYSLFCNRKWICEMYIFVVNKGLSLMHRNVMVANTNITVIMCTDRLLLQTKPQRKTTNNVVGKNMNILWKNEWKQWEIHLRAKWFCTNHVYSESLFIIRCSLQKVNWLDVNEWLVNVNVNALIMTKW